RRPEPALRRAPRGSGAVRGDGQRPRCIARAECAERGAAAAQSDLARARAVARAFGEHRDHIAVAEPDTSDERIADGFSDARDAAADDRSHANAEADNDDDETVAHSAAHADERPRGWVRPHRGRYGCQ